MAEPRKPNPSSYQAILRLRHDKPDERKQLEACVCAHLETAERAKWPRAIDYFENAAYLCGNHTTRYGYSRSFGLMTNTIGVHSRSKFDGVIAATADNRLVRPFERMVSMFSKGKPAPRIRPGSHAPDAKAASDAGARMLELVWESPLDMPVLRRRLAAAAGLTGTAAIETGYGPTDFPVEFPRMKRAPVIEAQDDKTRELYPNEPAESEPAGPSEQWVPDEEGNTDVHFAHDFNSDVWNALHLTPDPGARHERDLRWIARQTFEDIDGLWELYGDGKESDGIYLDRLRTVEEDIGRHQALFYWYRVQDLLDAPQGSEGSTTSAWSMDGRLAPGHASHYLLDHRPSRQFPRGRTMVMVGSQLVACFDQARAWSTRYPRRWHEYAFWRWMELEGRFWGIPLLSLQKALQKRINAVDALVRANRTYIAIGQWLLPRHAKMAEGRISALWGEQYTYNDIPGHRAPERVPNNPLPAELLNERVECKAAIDEIAAATLIDGQVAASAARAASLIQMLRSERLESKGSSVDTYERAIETTGQNVLIDAQLALEETEEGEDENPNEVAARTGAALELAQRVLDSDRDISELSLQAFLQVTVLDNRALRIDVASEILKSPEAEEQKAQEALQYAGQLMSPQQLQGAFEAAGMGEYMKSPENASAKRAEQMIADVLNGNTDAAYLMPGIESPAAMIPVFQEFVLSRRWATVPAEQRQVILQVLDALIAEIQQQAAEQQAAAAAAQQAAAPAEKQPGQPAAA